MIVEDEKLLLDIHRNKKYDEMEIVDKVLHLTLRPMQRKIVREFFEVDKKTGKPLFEEYMLVCGKKGGKTFLTVCMNLILVYKLLLIPNIFKKFELIPQDVYLLNTCAGKTQSMDVYLNQVKGMLTLSPFLNRFVKAINRDEVIFRIPNHDTSIILKAQSSRSTSSLGYLTYSVTFDELAWFQDSANRITSKEVYSALFPNIKPFNGFGYSFILSSPSTTNSWFYSHYEFALKSKTKMVIKKATWEMNPNITRESLEEEFQRDPDKAAMDYGAEFVENIGGAFTVEAVERALVLDNRDITVSDKRMRMIALDPGLKHDAYALAMGYIDNNFKVYIDYVRYWVGTRNNPVQIREVEDFLEYLNSKYILNKIVLDQRYSASTIQRFGAKGYPIFETYFDGGYKQKMYQVFKEKLNMSEVLLPRDEKVKSELIALKRKGNGANIRYEAPSMGPVKSDDMADAIANCVYQLSMLKEEGFGCDDFAIDGVIDIPQERKTDEQIQREKKILEAEAKKIEDEGGFIVS